MMLVDHHCHLDFPDFSADLESVIGRAKDAGVGTLVSISTKVRRFERLLELTKAHERIYCTVGTHPHYADEESDVPVAEIVRLARHPKVVAIGEAGLDYFYQNSSRAAQKQGFLAHIAAARATGLPLVIHARDADDDVGDILENESTKGKFAAVLHCYTGGSDLALRGLRLGLYISFSGILTFNKSDPLREIARTVPLDRVLVETDAPYLAPGRHRGHRNEPAYLVETARVLARVKGLTFEEIAAATTENFFRLYSKVPRPAAAA
jgi:TatD DNase family protein